MSRLLKEVNTETKVNINSTFSHSLVIKLSDLIKEIEREYKKRA